MKRKYIVLCLVLLVCSSSYAQNPTLALSQRRESKPFLFSALPETFSCNFTALKELLSGEIDEQITVQLSSQFIVKGKIVDKSQHTPGSFSINLRLENYHNALFNISVRLLPDNSSLIQGRIVHPRYSDILVLQKGKDSYNFKKKDQRLYMPE